MLVGGGRFGLCGVCLSVMFNMLGVFCFAVLERLSCLPEIPNYNLCTLSDKLPDPSVCPEVNVLLQCMRIFCSC